MSTALRDRFLVIGTLVAAMLLGVLLSAHYASAQPSSLVIQATAAATSSVSYLVPNVATSTYQFDSSMFSSGKIANMQPIDQVSLYIEGVASSTSTVFVITPQFSNNNIDWYNYGVATTTVSTAGVSPIAVPVSYQWTPGTTATSTTVILLPAVPAQHERVQFSASNASGAIYAEVDLKKNAAGSQ